ncbi:MAG: glycosyltransferase [Prevotella sp.]|nr:glycosyltransferase [Prevotella sp.]
MKILHYLTVTPATAPILEELRKKLSSSSSLEHQLLVYFKGMPIRRADDMVTLNPQSGRFTISVERRFLTYLYRHMPDIVHIHGAWSYTSYRVSCWCRRRGFPVVLSTHGMFDKKVLDQDFLKKRIPRIFLYQRRMVHSMRGIDASNSSESKQLSQLGWNKRIDIVCATDDPSVSIDFDKAYLKWYQKIFDTDVYDTFGQLEKESLCALLRVANTPVDGHQMLSAQSILTLRELTPPIWRRLFIYARDQHVDDDLRNAITRMQLTLTSSVTEPQERYPWKEGKNGDTLSDSEMLERSKRLVAILDNKIKTSEHDMRRMCIMLLNLRHLYKKKSLSLRHLCDFYRLVRDCDIDEDRLADFLDEMHIHRFTGRMMQILHEVLYLEEGYMLVEPLDDTGTEKIRKTLITLI